MPTPRTIADRLRADEPALVSSLDFGPFVRQGSGDGPTLIIGDPSEISLFDPTDKPGLEYRMGLLAHPGDVVLVRRRDIKFEAYLNRYLEMKGVAFVEVGKAGFGAIARLARQTPDLIDRLARLAAEHGGMTIKSYLTKGHVWRLAQAIGDASRQPVTVCGSSPRATRRVNDKLWFSRLVQDVLGENATPPTLSAYGPAATAGLVSYNSKRAERVVVKVPDSAGSTGNIRLQSNRVRAMSLTRLRRFLLDRLHAVGWRDRYPVLVGVWDTDVLCSPSAQLWLPRIEDGAPVCEAIFEQTVRGEAGTFVGASRSSLPPALQAQLRAQALRLAAVLQRIGYFGRCSFDAVIQRTPGGSERIHWIECNGRWGGVSIPLTALSQRAGRVPPGLVIVQETVPGRQMGTSELLDLVGDVLCDPGGEGLILTAPAQTAGGTLLSACAVAGTQEAAEDLVSEVVARLSGAGTR